MTADTHELPDMAAQEMYIVLAILMQMGHDVINILKSYWSTAEQFCTPFYINIMKCDKFLHILRFLHLWKHEPTRQE
jgi:hypothetical protein